MKQATMPALFVGHGNPMNALETNQFTETWRKLGESIPTPKSIVSVSAHWETKDTYVTGMEYPKTIHDFGGFPKQLFEVEYPAKGNPELASKITEIVSSKRINIDINNWGLDHGTWSVLVHMFPKADIPVIQLSLDRFALPEEHFNLGKELATLRNKGVLFVCSGNIIHNLRMVDWRNYDNQYDWAIKASNQIKTYIQNKEYDALFNAHTLNNDIALSVNSAEHYMPLFYLLGLEKVSDTFSFFNDEIIMGSLSMTGILLK
ncbi:MAG: 4,5-DOPA dioxygenase extradiol [Paludibacteraceae bacterium]